MKVVFVSGAYRASTVIGVHNNIMKARRLAIQLWGQGFAVICPHMNSAYFDGIYHDDVWLKGYLEMLKRCDVIAMVDGWEKSEGARAEHDLAQKLGMEIIVLNGINAD